jgi:hypothetical protein
MLEAWRDEKMHEKELAFFKDFLLQLPNEVKTRTFYKKISVIATTSILRIRTRRNFDEDARFHYDFIEMLLQTVAPKSNHLKKLQRVFIQKTHTNTLAAQ